MAAMVVAWSSPFVVSWCVPRDVRAEALVNTHLEEENRRFQAVSAMWMGRGFQSDDPTRDFRGGGLLALQNLVYMCEHHQARVIEMIQSVPPVRLFVLQAFGGMLAWCACLSKQRAHRSPRVVVVVVACTPGW